VHPTTAATISAPNTDSATEPRGHVRELLEKS
jgi:hypothetical protein